MFFSSQCQVRKVSMCIHTLTPAHTVTRAPVCILENQQCYWAFWQVLSGLENQQSYWAFWQVLSDLENQQCYWAFWQVLSDIRDFSIAITSGGFHVTKITIDKRQHICVLALTFWLVNTMPVITMSVVSGCSDTTIMVDLALKNDLYLVGVN